MMIVWIELEIERELKKIKNHKFYHFLLYVKIQEFNIKIKIKIN